MTRRLRSALHWAAIAIVAGAWAVTLRPQVLGGPAAYLAVRGTSMLPTYQNGDLVLVEARPPYTVGEVVAYRVPAGEIGAGKIVIHRITAGDAERGFVLRGDNNSAADPWIPKPSDIVGVATVRLPYLGRIVAAARQPLILAALAAALVVTLILARPSGRRPACVARSAHSVSRACRARGP